MLKEKGYSDLESKGNKFVSVDPDRCIGCGICELVCSMEKSNKKSFNPSRSRIRIQRLHPAINIAMACRLCEDAPCVAACPRNALLQSKENGVILVDEEKCTGCGWCFEACDFGSITLEPEGKVAVVCDLCKERKGIGIFPGRAIANQACIEWCPEEALQLVTKNRQAQKARETAAANLLSTREEKNHEGPLQNRR